MKLLLSSLLFSTLCTLSSWSVSSGPPVVTQSPDRSVMEGDTINITCCWTGTSERMTVNWLKNQTHIKNETSLKSQSVKNETNCLSLIFKNITQENSGRYICKVSVEIPVYKSAEGNGTVITVMARDNMKDETGGDKSSDSSSNSLPVPVKAAVAVMVPLLLITLVCLCILRRKQAQVTRVIYEVPHIDSEEADMEKHSTSSSRGSSQWCQVPVYESYAYFEHVPTKESG